MNKSFSQQEIRFIEILDTIQWIARDLDGSLHGYFSEPHKKGTTWSDNSYIKCNLETDLPFDCVKWEDEKATDRYEILYGLINHNKFFNKDEQQLIKLLDKIEWICRNESGTLIGFYTKPFKKGNTWTTTTSYGMPIPTSLTFDAILWNDREPINREKILGENKINDVN